MSKTIKVRMIIAIVLRIRRLYLRGEISDIIHSCFNPNKNASLYEKVGACKECDV